MGPASRGAERAEDCRTRGWAVTGVAMRPADFALMLVVCVVWAANNILSKYVVSVLEIPPLFYAAARFAVLSLATFPFLFPMPRPRWRLIAVALLMGGGNFA